LGLDPDGRKCDPAGEKKVILTAKNLSAGQQLLYPRCLSL